jgi:uncharacterized membrane protein
MDRRGFGSFLIIAVIVLAVLVVGGICYYATNNHEESTTSFAPNNTAASSSAVSANPCQVGLLTEWDSGLQNVQEVLAKTSDSPYRCPPKSFDFLFRF